MNITTKYDIGDVVYVISEGSLVKRTISEIKISLSANVTFTHPNGIMYASVTHVDKENLYKKVVYGWVGATTYYFDEDACWPSPEQFVTESK